MAASPEQAIASALRLPRTQASLEKLRAMLRHDARHFSGLSTADAEWLRGQLLAIIADRGACEAIKPTLLEELRTSSSPVVLAGAARVARSLAARDRPARELLSAAISRISRRDEPVEFVVDGRVGRGLSARQELEEAFASLTRVQEESGEAPGARTAVSYDWTRDLGLGQPELEDQDGRRILLAQLASGAGLLLAPFYVRCMNSEKCSATIVRLGKLAEALAGDPTSPKVSIVGLSYDPTHDTPDRLRKYGAARGFPFSDRALLVRCARSWPALRSGLGLQAGYGDTTVNDHARELFLIAPDLSFVRLDPELLSRPTELLKCVQLAVR